MVAFSKCCPFVLILISVSFVVRSHNLGTECIEVCLQNTYPTNQLLLFIYVVSDSDGGGIISA